MDLVAIEAALQAALVLRTPTFQPGARGREKINALEDYMLASASINGDLVEARHWLREIEQKLRDDWDHMQGWEVALTVPASRATKPQIQHAKITVSPQMFEAGRKATRLRESVVDQIARLEREERVMSRVYTMISGA